MRTRVKICGITREVDIKAAVNEGVDAIGLNFSIESAGRQVSIEQAKALLADIPAFMTMVAIFVNQETKFIQSVLQQCHFDLLQFHGSEPPDYCQSFSVPYIKAIAIQEDLDVAAECLKFKQAKAILLDTHVATRAGGGAGKTFDWQRVPSQLTQPLILAGGLNPDNIKDAISSVKPYAVDVCGGVESGEKGIKDHSKIAKLMQEVHRADNG